MKKILLTSLLFICNTVFAQVGCTNLSLPFTENFETTSLTLNCWIAINANNDGQQWNTSLTNPYAGTQCKAISIQSLAQFGTANDWLISPEINLGSDGVTKQLKFYVRLSPLQHAGWRVAQKLRVAVSTNAGQTAADFTVDVLPNQYFSNEYYKMVLVDLVNAQGVALQGNVRVGFHILETVNPVGRGMYIDDVSIAAKPTCPQPTDVDACADATTATAFWDSPASVTEWEYSVVFAGQEPTFPGTATTTPSVDLTNLLPNVDYVIYVRSKCGTTYSNYVPYYFKTIPSVIDANPFCGDSGSIVFANNYGQPNTSGYGPVACLSFSPNPIWYYFEVSQSGNLEFNILQNTLFDGNGNPIGTNLDVDYAAFGPFNSLQEACDLIDVQYCLDCPSYQQVNNPGSVPANAYPNGIIVDCSPSPSYIEQLTINNAVEGQIYAVLISNWDGLQGFIKLEQTNIGEPGAGSTNCEFMCTVDLGDDIVVCNDTSYVLTADVSSEGAGDITAIRWYNNNVLMDPTIYNTLTINVTQDGVYKIEVEKEQCEEDVISDEIWIRFVQSFPLNSIPNQFVVCDVNNDGAQNVNFALFQQGFMNATQSQDYVVNYYLSQANANNQTNPINPLTYNLTATTVLYVRISHVLNNDCVTIKPVDFILQSMSIPVVGFSYESPICGSSKGTIMPQTVSNFSAGGSYSSTNGLSIHSQTGAIDLVQSTPGIYSIKYSVAQDLINCVANQESVFTFELYPDVDFMIQPACDQQNFVLSLVDLLGTINLNTVSYHWTGSNGLDSTSSEIVITENGLYTLKITTDTGCVIERSIDIDDTTCFIQKGISPNGDGLNDSFRIENYIVSSLKIFNRHGKEVFTFDGDYKDQWHGQDNSGNELPDGTYFYELFTHKGPITGWIQINK